MRTFGGLLVTIALVAFTAPAAAQPRPDTVEPPADAPRRDPQRDAAPADVKDAVPLVAYTHAAFGAPARTGGAAGFFGVVGGATAARDGGTSDFGGGARLWVSPLDRLTLHAEVDRRAFGDEAAPSVGVSVRIAGDRARGWALGGLLSYRTEGFAEIPGEVETAALVSFARGRIHTDANFVFGTGVEEREMDGELALRVGYDLTTWLRLGADGRFRYRVAGDKGLPGDRAGDAVGGPEALFGYKSFFLAVGGGPSTVGISTRLGWNATTTIGGALL